MDNNKYIESKSSVRFGKPCIKSTRISVCDIQAWLRNGMTEEEILNDFPELTYEQIEACKRYKPD